MGKLMDKMGVKANRLYLKTQKHAPEIALGLGVVTFIGTVVLAGRQTLKAREVLEQHKQDMDDIHEAVEIDEKYAGSEQPVLDKRGTYCRTAVGMAKSYVPVIAMGSTSLALFLYSNRLLNKRYLAAVAFGNSVSGAFEAYRKRVREEEGVEADRHYLFGTERKEVVDISKNEKGKKVENKTEIELAPDVSDGYEYTRIFDESNKNWDPDIGLNLMFLRSQEQIWNNVLDTRGHVILNEVLDSLGFDMTQIGGLVGWVKGNGDGYIDFGLRDYSNPGLRRFINGDNNIVPLEFNCDGMILDKI